MHPNKSFRVMDRSRLLGFVRQRSFGQIVAVTASGLRGASIPVLVDDNGEAASLRFHLSRGNELVPALKDGAEVFATFLGADAYISPDWYGVPDQVPTWNYIAVHVRGKAEALPAEALPQILDDLSAEHEARLSPKTPWTRAKMTPEKEAAMRNGIVGFALRIESIEGTWKLGQNKSEAVIHGAISGLNKNPDPMSQEMAQLMREELES